jgi:hypothetical protein
VYPLGLLIEPITNRDVKVSNLSVVEGEALRQLIEGPFVMEDVLFMPMELVFVGFGGDGGVSLTIGDGLQ